MMIKGHDGSSSDEKEGKPKQSLAMQMLKRKMRKDTLGKADKLDGE